MEIERETVVEIVASTGAVLLFVAVIVGIGVTYGGNGLSGRGAFALIGSILLFVIVMTAIGYWLSGR